MKDSKKERKKRKNKSKNSESKSPSRSPSAQSNKSVHKKKKKIKKQTSQQPENIKEQQVQKESSEQNVTENQTPQIEAEMNFGDKSQQFMQKQMMDMNQLGPMMNIKIPGQNMPFMGGPFPNMDIGKQMMGMGMPFGGQMSMNFHGGFGMQMFQQGPQGKMAMPMQGMHPMFYPPGPNPMFRGHMMPVQFPHYGLPLSEINQNPLFGNPNQVKQSIQQSLQNNEFGEEASNQEDKTPGQVQNKDSLSKKGQPFKQPTFFKQKRPFNQNMNQPNAQQKSFQKKLEIARKNVELFCYYKKNFSNILPPSLDAFIKTSISLKHSDPTLLLNICKKKLYDFELQCRDNKMTNVSKYIQRFLLSLHELQKKEKELQQKEQKEQKKKSSKEEKEKREEFKLKNNLEEQNNISGEPEQKEISKLYDIELLNYIANLDDINTAYYFIDFTKYRIFDQFKDYELENKQQDHQHFDEAKELFLECYNS